MSDRRNDTSGPPEGSLERSGGLPSGAAEPDPEVLERPTRRRFTAPYKASIVREARACLEPGAIGALLRREGLHSSHLSSWRKQLEQHGVDGLKAKKRGPAPKPKKSTREIELERKTRQLEKRLAKAEALIEFQKKVHELLGIPLKNHELEDDD